MYDYHSESAYRQILLDSLAVVVIHIAKLLDTFTVVIIHIAKLLDTLAVVVIHI
jgi:hypothetical protein